MSASHGRSPTEDDGSEHPQRWKLSRYVTEVDLERVGTLLLYGGLSGRLIEVTGARRGEVRTLLENPNAETFRGETGARRMLEDQGFLVPEPFDELALLEHRHTAAHEPAAGPMALTICPTVNCNYRCVYCYQHHLGSLMTDAIQDKLIAFLGDQTLPVSSLYVTWFGGEPLLGQSVIEQLTPMLRDLVGESTYSAKMISNGWLLTRETSSRLVDLGVRSVQVTLDGPRAVHDQRRPRRGGQPTFDRILENIAGADPRLAFTVRVNTDKRNAGGVVDLFDQLDAAGLRGRVMVYFAPVVAYTDVCADTAGDCLAGMAWSKLHAELRLQGLQRGYGGPGLPRSKTGVCIADNPRGWVVAPDGLVYKCWNDVTQPDNAVFDLATGQQSEKMKAELDRWRQWSPFKLSECLDCKVLPQCHSGCAHLAMQQEGEIDHGDCTDLKWNLPETIATYYLGHKRRESAKKLESLLPPMPAEASEANTDA